MCGICTVNSPRWVALPVASINTDTKGGVNGVMVTTPSRLPLKGTCSPAATGLASPRTANPASARPAAELYRFMLSLLVVCDTMKKPPFPARRPSAGVARALLEAVFTLRFASYRLRGTTQAPATSERQALRFELAPASPPLLGSVLLLFHPQQGRGLGAEADENLIFGLVLVHPCDGL